MQTFSFRHSAIYASFLPSQTIEPTRPHKAEVSDSGTGATNPGTYRWHYDGGVLETTLELSLREKIRHALVEEVPEASGKKIEKALDRIMTAVDPFEHAAASVLARYDKIFAELAT